MATTTTLPPNVYCVQYPNITGTCNIPPPTHEECAQIPICSDQDQYQAIAMNSICSTSFQISSCLAGFMYMDPANISARPPYPFHTTNPYLDMDINVTDLECYELHYPYTRACCPGYYCPEKMYCMIPCTTAGSYCPSSTTATYPDCVQADIDDAQITFQYQHEMGCGGSYIGDSMCPAGTFCSNSSMKEECPQGYACREGSTEAFKCSFLINCPAGTTTPANDSIAASILFVIMLTAILLLLFWDKFKKCTYQCWLKIYFKIHEEDWEEVRKERNKFKKMNEPTMFSPATDGLNYRPYKTLDVTSYNQKLLDDENEIELQEDPANSLWTEDGDDSGSDEDDKKSDGNEAHRLKFFMDIEFRDLSLHLKANNKTILNKCSGYLHCGTVNAIMGPSGAGKTSFLYTLCGKAAAYGNISGDIRINGEQKNIFDFKDIVGFVPQSDTMTAEMTVKEMLEFNAKFRLSSDVSFNYRKSVVRDVLKLLKIKRIRHSFIGDDVKRGISGGQQKRVNIGMELVSHPSVIFLDEPTSGLDSTTSNDVMEVLRLIANRGTLVLVVLHQPRYEIFSSFDNVVLLAEGGKMVYMGDTMKAMPYFEQFGYKKPEFVNPADFMMDVITGTVKPEDKAKPDLVQKWKEMDTKETWTMKSNQVFNNELMDKQHKNNAKYEPRSKLSLPQQIVMCTKRNVTVLWRQKTTLISDMVMITMIGFIIGYITDSDVFEKLASNIFNAIITSSIVGCIISLRVFGSDRIMYWRFSAVGINRFAYYIGATIASFPWIFLHPLIFLMFYWPMAMPRGSFAVYFTMISLGMFCAQGLGHLISVIVDPSKSILVSVVIVMIMNFLCGFEPTLASFNDIMRFVADLSFARWQQEAIWTEEVLQWPDIFQTKKDQQSEYYGYSLDHNIYSGNIVKMIIIGFVFRILTFLALIFTNRAKQM